MRLLTEFNHSELEQLQTSIVVEVWIKRTYGRAKRAWLSEFSETERRKAGTLYKTFYSWHFIKGIPEKKVFDLETYEFIKRLVNFFATV